nr:hypothetical protein [Tanacetum cinerariifolium]
KLLESHEKAFFTGLIKFVDDCKPLVNSAKNVKCPCKSCRIVFWVSIENLLKHITRYGWDPALLNELSYIPPNNKPNEPNQGDIGKTNNEPAQAKCNKFKEFYASAIEELYPGCDYVTRLDFMEKFTYFMVKGLAADCFNPFGNLSQAYNMWPMILRTYNLPPWLCMKEGTFMPRLFIPGPKSPDKDIDTINDLPARSSLSGWSGQGYKACPTFIRFDAQELKKVIWYVLHNSPKIDTYRSQFKSAIIDLDEDDDIIDDEYTLPHDLADSDDEDLVNVDDDDDDGVDVVYSSEDED